jgi:DNA-binding NtrC family response regulator
MASPSTILLVEDDEAVREATARTLTAQGFRLLVARDAHEAIRLIAENHVDALFTDIVMYGFNGIELAKAARKLQPEIKIMFMTGYYSAVGNAERYGKVLFKPVRSAEIEAELSKLLRAGV